MTHRTGRTTERVRTWVGPDPLAADADLDVGPGCGAVQTFLGRVRADGTDGRVTTSLLYEAHPSAGDLLHDLAQDIALRHQVEILAAHRTGDVGLGEVALLTVVAGAHRAEVFTATVELVDRIKAELPIWKNERYSDGSDAWAGLCP
jgi:molybdopterin synthase catalytic subunit